MHGIPGATPEAAPKAESKLVLVAVADSALVEGRDDVVLVTLDMLELVDSDVDVLELVDSDDPVPVTPTAVPVLRMPDEVREPPKALEVILDDELPLSPWAHL